MKIRSIVIFLIAIHYAMVGETLITEVMILEHVGVLVGQLVEQHLSDCHLVMMTTDPRSNVFFAIQKSLRDGVVVLDTSQTHDNHLPKALAGGPYVTCRALILHVGDNINNNNQTLEKMERAGLWKMPETRVLVVAMKTEVEEVLLHPCFRNTIHAVYLVLPAVRPPPSTLMIFPEQDSSFGRENVSIYRRCLYCNYGNPAVNLVLYGKITSLLSHQPTVFSSDQLQDVFGHTFNVVTVSYFPFIDYYKDKDVPGSTVTLRDSVDTRLIQTISAKLNFTTVIHEEPKRNWGLETDGQFNGMIGQLQREEADFCTEAAPTPGRLRVVEYARGYPSDVMSLTSLKPRLLPQHTALVRPFLADVWVGVAVGVVVWSVAIWILQRTWRLMRGRIDIPFPTLFLYGWGALVEQPPKDPSVTLSGQMLVGWWLVFCLVISTGFRSSLIAHLTVQGTTKPIETLEDLVKLKNWKWGTEEKLYKGAVIEYFSNHSDPMVKQIHANLEVLDSDDALGKVLQGGYTLICFNDYVTVIVNSRYTDAHGRSPYYTSRKGFPVFANLGWAFRKGAPFYSRFNLLLNRLEDAGLTRYWTKDVVKRRIKENRDAGDVNKLNKQVGTLQENVKQVVLGLEHVQGAFYVLFFGSGAALLLLVVENILQFAARTGAAEDHGHRKP